MEETLSTRYYRLALAKARERNLSTALYYARLSLSLNANHKPARRLLGLCLYEMGDAALETECPLLFKKMAPEIKHMREVINQVRLLVHVKNAKNMKNMKKWRKAEAMLNALPHQNIRVLMLHGCLCAVSGRYRKAVVYFARALEKDCGHSLARECLIETAKNLSVNWPMRIFSLGK